MTDLVNNEASSSRTPPAVLVPHMLRAPAGAEHLICQSVEPTFRQRSESNERPIVYDSGIYPTGSYHQNHAGEASDLRRYLNSDEHLMVYRRFAIVHSRALLQKNDQLRQMAEAQYNLDEEEFMGMHEMTVGEPQNRRVVVSMLDREFPEYCKQIMLYRISFCFKI